MEKGIEELLKPRYKVIADYPGSDFEVGGIIEMIAFNVDVFKDFPHLFKRLEWWQERTIEEMESVKYAKVIKYRGYWREGDIVKIEKFVHGSVTLAQPTGYYLKYKHYQPVFELQPATEQEYLNSLPNKQNK